MKVRSFTLAAALVALAVVGLPAAPEPAAPATMPVSAIRPGMTGVGRTVFQGAQLADFTVHILGVLANVIGPRRNLILARLEGGPLADTGVIAGMSGSPVYIDGKLIGAVSYALGSFSKEPIAGITPIAEMTDSAQYPERRPVSAAASLRLPLTPQSVARALRAAVSSWIEPFAADPGDVRAEGVGTLLGMSAGQVGSLLRPIATPLVMGGFDPAVSSMLADALRSDAFLPVTAGASAQAVAAMANQPLRPGDAIGVNLVSGDLELGGVGTVTAIENGHVYAFGHPLYNLGPTQFPMTRAYVYTILPSLYSSTKIAATTDVIGTFQQDRATAISGTLGPGPALIPIHVSLRSERGTPHDFTFQVVRDQLFTPLMTYASILNTLGSYERQYGAATFSVKGTATLKGHG
ncbi:MAG TPA: SpoIVB peptidase S55 domain-containing protein, partial [Vicinamibacterales bacterium]|nr:SpoIVB peptidase S55 domain-containing protein [Vicinamibacterales bacterium]